MCYVHWINEFASANIFYSMCPVPKCQSENENENEDIIKILPLKKFRIETLNFG